MRARALRRSFRRLILAAVVGPAAAVPVVACAGGPDSPDDAARSANGNGNDGDESTSGSATGGGSNSSSTFAGECRAAEKLDAAAVTCGSFVIELVGDPTTCKWNETGDGTYQFCQDVCGQFVSSCKRRGTSGVECVAPCAVDGRRYTDLDDSSAPRAHDVASYLARMAFFEAASVDSFTLLRDELTKHGAPRALVAACTTARNDEIRHARMASRLARRHGGAVLAPPDLAASGARALEEIAIENAVEGCVRETFGVLVGMWQAEHAPTKELRAFFAKLAHDESRHAALALRVDAWVRTRLDAAAIARLDAAHARALAELEASLATEPVSGLGLPRPVDAARIFAAWTATTSLAA